MGLGVKVTDEAKLRYALILDGKPVVSWRSGVEVILYCFIAIEVVNYLTWSFAKRWPVLGSFPNISTARRMQYGSRSYSRRMRWCVSRTGRAPASRLTG